MKSFKNYLMETKKRKSNVDFDRIDKIDKMANEYHEYDYQDMIYDILKRGTDKSDEQIAKEVAQKAAQA